MGVSALRRVQVAREAVPFAAQAATYRLVGLVPELSFEPAFDMIGGWLGGFARSTGHYVTERSGTGSLKGPLLRDVEGLIAFAHGMHSYTRTGAGTPYTYAFRQNFGTVPTVPTLTMEMGDNQEILRGVGGIVTDFTLDGAVGKAVQVAASLQFGDVLDNLASFTTITAGTPDYSVPTRRPPVVLTNNMRLLVGGVDIAANLIGFSFKYNTGLTLQPRVNGSLALNTIAYGIPEVDFTCSVETSANQAAFLAAIPAETVQTFELRDHPSTPTFSVKWAGQFVTSGPIGDSDGTSMIEFSVKEVYNPATNVDPLLITVVTPNASYA